MEYGIFTSGSVLIKNDYVVVKLSWVIHPILPWKRPRCCLLWELRIWFSSALQDPRRSRSANPSSRRWGTRPSWQCTKKSWSKWRTTTCLPLSALTRPWETRIQPVQSEISFGDMGQSETRFSDMNLKQPCVFSPRWNLDLSERDSSKYRFWKDRLWGGNTYCYVYARAASETNVLTLILLYPIL